MSPPEHINRRGFLRTSAAAAGAALSIQLGGCAGRPVRKTEEEVRLALRTPEDRKLSPFTGYTREHWLEITERLIAGILPHIDPESGMPMLDGVPGDRAHAALYPLDKTVARWQAMERIMMLVVYYSAATGRDRVPGWNGSISARFVKGIARMSDPADPLHCARKDPSVYMGSETALAIMLAPQFFWEPLSAGQKEKVLRFLEDLARQPAYDNNHHLFHMVPVPLLERNGRSTNRAKLSAKMEQMLSWHRGDGWLVDGSNGGFDHYNFWGFHLYLNALCHLDTTWRERYGSQIRSITSEFLQSATYFFGRDGGPIPWGRSLAYRFADNSALGWAHLNGANPLPPGQARRMASGCLRYFWDHGALDKNGVMELGYHQANAVVAEDYLTYGTGYFAAQGLSCLLIPEQDPFWTDKESPIPADDKGGRIVLKGAEMVVRVRAKDGEARLFPVGQPFGHEGHWQRGVKYAQHAYSSALGWCALGEGSQEFGAGRTGFSLDGQNWTYRSHPVPLEISSDHVASYYALDGSGRGASKKSVSSKESLSGRIVTHTLIGEVGEVHVFWHTSPQALFLYLGGYGINISEERMLSQQPGNQRLLIEGEGKYSWLEQILGPAGKFSVNRLNPRPGWRHSHFFGGLGVFPDWRSLAPVGALTPVVLSLDGGCGRSSRGPKVAAHKNGSILQVRFEGKTFNLEFA